MLATVPGALSLLSTTTCSTACEREDTSLAAVAAWDPSQNKELNMIRNNEYNIGLLYLLNGLEYYFIFIHMACF
jgi:hypothetical protein